MPNIFQVEEKVQASDLKGRLTNCIGVAFRYGVIFIPIPGNTTKTKNKDMYIFCCFYTVPYSGFIPL